MIYAFHQLSLPFHASLSSIFSMLWVLYFHKTSLAHSPVHKKTIIYARHDRKLSRTSEVSLKIHLFGAPRINTPCCRSQNLLDYRRKPSKWTAEEEAAVCAGSVLGTFIGQWLAILRLVLECSREIFCLKCDKIVSAPPIRLLNAGGRRASLFYFV